MPQSLLALLSAVLISLVAIQQTRSGHRTDADLDREKIVAVAAEVAVERLAFLESLPFDEVTKAGRAKTLADLTQVANGQFFRVPAADPPGDDLDDFHGTQTSVTRVLQEGSPGQPMVAAVTVQYVRESDGTTPSSAPTRLKRATVVVTSPGIAPVQLSQVYSCAGYCVW
jgi:hypothetical protein